VARAANTVRNVSSEGLSNSSPSQKGDYNRDHNENARHNNNIAQESGTESEDELVTEAGKEVQCKNNCQQSRNNQGDQSEGLGQLDDAEAGRRVNIKVEGVILNLLLADSLGGDTLKRIKVAGGIQNLLGDGLINERDSGNLVVRF